MRSIPNHNPHQEGTSSSAINRGLLGLLAKPTAKSSGSAESFGREVERAVERQGGQKAIEARRLESSNSRRSARHSSFGGERGPDSEPRLRERRELEEPRAEAVPIERQVQPSENRRAAQPRAEAPARALPQADGSATSAGRRAPEAPGPQASAPRAPEGAALGVPIAPGVPQAGPATAGAPAVASAATAVQPAQAARPVNGTQAFVDAAKATKPGPEAPKQAAPAGSTPDPKLIEHAEKVLRQIRVNLRPGMNEITLNLKPVDLGRLSIDLRMQSGALAAVVRAESPETLELLKQQAPELRAVLAQEGIRAEELEFKLAFEAGQGHAQEHGQPTDGESKQAATQAEPTQPQSSPTLLASKAQDDGGIDTLA